MIVLQKTKPTTTILPVLYHWLYFKVWYFCRSIQSVQTASDVYAAFCSPALLGFSSPLFWLLFSSRPQALKRYFVAVFCKNLSWSFLRSCLPAREVCEDPGEVRDAGGFKGDARVVRRQTNHCLHELHLYEKKSLLERGCRSLFLLGKKSLYQP